MNSLELKGYFYLPEKPDEQLPGILRFNQSDGIGLDLFGQFSSYINPASRENNIVLGFTSNGKKVTLLNCYEKTKSMNMPGFPQSEFSALYLFVGQTYFSADEISFTKCSLEYADFNHWLNISGFEKPKWDEVAQEISISYKQPGKVDFSLCNGWNAEINFYFIRPWEFFAPKAKAAIEQTPVLTISPVAKSTFKEFQKVYSIFNAFLALNYFTFPLIKGIVFFEPNIKENQSDDDYVTVEFYFKIKKKAKKYKDHSDPHDFLLQFKKIQHRFPVIIQNWYSLHAKIEPTINVLTESFFERGSPTEFYFLGFVQGLENMHRTLRGNKIKLNKRLSEIIENLPISVTEGLLSNEGNFITRVRDNRDYFTHYSLKDGFISAPLSELFMLAEKLKIILITSVLMELSFTKNEAEDIIYDKGKFLFNHVIDYRKMHDVRKERLRQNELRINATVEILSKYHQRLELSESEYETLQDWLKESHDNGQLFEDLSNEDAWENNRPAGIPNTIEGNLQIIRNSLLRQLALIQSENPNKI